MYWPWRGNINRREVKELTFICCGLPLSGAGLHTLCWNTTVSPLSCQRPHLTWLQLLFSVCVGMAMLAAPRAPCSASFLPDEARMCPKLPPPSPFAWGSSEPGVLSCCLSSSCATVAGRTWVLQPPKSLAWPGGRSPSPRGMVQPSRSPCRPQIQPDCKLHNLASGCFRNRSAFSLN